MLNNLWKTVCDLWLPIIYFAVIIVAIIFFIRFVVKKKRIGIAATLIVVALMFVGGIVYSTPHHIVDVNTENVAKIEISEATVTDKETIKEILDNLNSSEYRRTFTSGIGGYAEYSVRIYDESGKMILHIGIMDEQTVDTGLFWEKRVDGKLNLD